MSFIKSAVTASQNRNKGAYLHGRFGSGKSHFMAVLHLLLQGNTVARGIPELGHVVKKHDDWMQSRNCLLVPYHMIGADSVESGILGGYARHIRKLHPDAPVPGFYMSGRLFQQLTINKLAALNHGTIKSPIPGREAQTVLTKCRKWAGQVGEIKITDDQNPVIAVQLSGVDTESIIEQARIVDNPGNRRRLLREMVFDAFDITDSNQLFVEHEFLWRGSRRRVEVLFQNIREISDMSTFEARGDEWRVIIDFPFDEANHSPMASVRWSIRCPRCETVGEKLCGRRGISRLGAHPDLDR